MASANRKSGRESRSSDMARFNDGAKKGTSAPLAASHIQTGCRPHPFREHLRGRAKPFLHGG